MKAAIYVSAHGYGHTTRSWEVARALVESGPEAQVYFMGWAPQEVVAAEAHPRILYRRLKLDVGIRQTDSLTMDLPGTLEDLAALEAQSEELVTTEADFLRREKIDLALIDIPPLAFEAAARAGVPAVAMGNFSWDWIYQAYVSEYPDLKPHILRIRRAYRSARLLFRLPFHGKMAAFRQVVDVPLVARRSRLGRTEARRRLGINGTVPVVLFSFGGFGLKFSHSGLPGIGSGGKRFPARAEALAGMTSNEELILISTDPSPDPGGPFLHVPDRKLLELGLRYPDLVAAADAVVSKPGYGIVSETIANGAALLYMPRGRFREYPILVREMKRYLRAEKIAPEDLASGQWIKALRRVIHAPLPEDMDCSGAKVLTNKVNEIVNH